MHENIATVNAFENCLKKEVQRVHPKQFKQKKALNGGTRDLVKRYFLTGNILLLISTAVSSTV